MDLWEKKARANLEAACTRYLETELPKSDTWAGSETLKAVSQMRNVNILIINENGDFHFHCCFNAHFEQTLILAYTTCHVEEHEVTDFENGAASISNVSNVKRIHYDSVIHIEQEDVFTLSKILASNAHKRSMLNMDTYISINDTFDSEN